MKFAVAILVLLCLREGVTKQLPPVILVPGDGGTRMEAKLNKPNRGPHKVCTKTTKNYYTIWLSIPSVLLPWGTECFVDNFRLEYNRTSHRTHSPEGVDMRIPLFGETDSVEWLNDDHFIVYYADLVKSMVKFGYERGKTVRGAPYDFRKAPNELDEFYTNFTKLVEDTYTMNNNTRVVVIGHSLGNLVMLYYLNRQSQAWKDKYIRALITLSSPWGGSVKTVGMIASGYNIHIPTVKTLDARVMQRTMSSSSFLMPSNQFWNKSEVIVQTPHRNYTVNDYKQFFADLDFEDGYLMRKDTEHLVNPLRPPNVEVHCLYSYGVQTSSKMIYTAKQWPDQQPQFVTGNGDGTVSMKSLEGCLPWKHLQKQPFYSQRFQGVKHTDTIKSDIIVKSIEGILKSYS